MEETIAAIATPPGSGGIAVIRLSGENALEIADKIIRLKNTNKSLLNMPGYQAAYGTVVQNGREIDDVVALVFRAPHSYTGENTVEISCHGGQLISMEVLNACLAAGAKMASPGEFTRRAFMNGKLSLTQAEAVVELISASSKRQAASARQSVLGHQNQELIQIKSELIALAAHLTAWIDYPEEDVTAPEERAFIQKIAALRQKLDDTLLNYEQLNRIKRGFKVVISGSPNVGKSTLFNLLLGEDRAITTPIAGTTRDVLQAEISLDGIPLHLFDTAGLRQSQNPVEAEGIRRGEREMGAADILVYVMEASGSGGPIHAAIPEGVPSLCILNKSDLAQPETIAHLQAQFSRVLVVSAKEQASQAREEILSALRALLSLDEINPDAAIINSSRQQQEAQKARNCLLAIESEAQDFIKYDITQLYLEDAIQAMMALTGENATEEILEEVFSRFCVGK